MEIKTTRDNATLTLTIHNDKPIQYDELLEDFEKTVIGKMIERCGGIKARAADYLKLNRTTLVEKARKHGFPLKK